MASEPPAADQRDEFATTHWSLVVAAGGEQSTGAKEALARLCESYWYPVYAFVRRQMGDVHEAQDLTQEFFATLLEKQSLQAADPERGRFRTFLLTACKHFLINEWRKGQARKRGGGRRLISLDFISGESKLSLITIDALTAEQLFEREWAVALLERVTARLQHEYAAKHRNAHFESLKPFLSGSPGRAAHSAAARKLGISETTAKVAAHRLRKRYRELLREEIAQTVARPEEIDCEIRDLFSAFGSR